jgi:hypothetical protein
MERRGSKSRSQAGLKRYEIVIKNRSFQWFSNRKECGYTYAISKRAYTKRGKKMTAITIAGLKEILKQEEIIFVRQGRSGKAVHIAIGTGYTLACGEFGHCTESRRPSAIIRLSGYTEMDNKSLCKKCLKVVQVAVTPLVGA